jgi:flagellar biosynthesis protein FliQ
MTAFWLAAPLLIVGFIAGIIVSLVQIATSMQDNAFSTAGRISERLQRADAVDAQAVGRAT